MLKHRGFPGRLPGTDHQFTIRRANPRGVVHADAEVVEPEPLHHARPEVLDEHIRTAYQLEQPALALL